mgnify:CR=1 FL=1
MPDARRDAASAHARLSICRGFERRLGSLAAGKLADIVILSGNPFEMNPMALRDLEVETTIFNGCVVYRKDEA